MREVLILGATGSIGSQALKYIKTNPEFKIVGISVNKNYLECSKIIDEFQVENVAVSDNEAGNKLKEKYPNLNIFIGQDSSERLIESCKCDIVLNAISGIAGLSPSFKAIECGRILALANKETVVCGNELFKSHVKKYKGVIYPVDSEHSALYKLLTKYDKDEIDSLVITASGGSMRDFDMSKDPTIEDVLKHPTWNMGKKITIDSATMLNKAFEFIEASVLFDFPISKIKLLMHDESIIHAGLLLKDGSFIFEICPNDMIIPIAHALNEGKRQKIESTKEIDVEHFPNLNFRTFEATKYPIFDIVLHAYSRGGTSMAIINASSEVACDLFLKGKIKFKDIATIIDKTYKSTRIDTLDSVENIIYSSDLAKARALEVYEELK